MPRYRFEPRARGTSPEQQRKWRNRHHRPVDLETDRSHVFAYLEAITAIEDWDRGASYNQITRQMGRAGHPIYSKAHLRQSYLAMVRTGEVDRDPVFLSRIQMKPVRTQSGVLPISVLTKPFPCPGQCIFCPNDVQMPKSYLSNEPAGMRALMLEFDPYIQVRQRLEAAERIGHRAEKVELLILGGTWSSYPPDYQEWFIRRMFDALNGVDAETLEEAHAINETAGCRNTGLVVETRPDHVTLEEITRLRRMGVTRVQIGAQSLNDHILEINKRGHTLEQFREAMRLLRGAGFKVIVHWMPNLLGATPESDLEEFRQFWSDPTLRPDELKIYPTGLLRGTELFEYYQRGEYQPYSDQQTLDLLKACKVTVPGYCRLDRVMRDIPKPEIVEGVTTSNLRQIAQAQLKVEGRPCRCVRCREVKRSHVDPNTATLKVEWYDTDHSQEAFISIVTDDDLLTGFLRLSLPTTDVPFAEIEGCGMIRQVQVYGPALALGESADGPAQHQGFGTTLLGEAFRLTAEKGFKQIAVIAAVGTREYYRRFGFRQGNLYMLRDL